MTLACVVLAAGAATRFGSQKLLAPLLNGDRLIDRALRAVAQYPRCVVASPAVAMHLADRDVDIVVNDRPDLGMSRSLQLAAARVSVDVALIVLPADLALIEPQHVTLLGTAAQDYDVTYPQHSDGTPGHPVVFSPKTRPYIEALSPRESISVVRDRLELTRRVLPIDEPWPYCDVDRESDLSSIEADFPSGRFEPR